MLWDHGVLLVDSAAISRGFCGKNRNSGIYGGILYLGSCRVSVSPEP